MLRAMAAWGVSSGAALLLTLRLIRGRGHPFYLKNTLECGPLRARTASHQLNGHKARKDVLIPKHTHFFGTIYLLLQQISLKQADNWPLLPFLGLPKGNTLGDKKEEEKRPSF